MLSLRTKLIGHPLESNLFISVINSSILSVKLGIGGLEVELVGG